MFQTAEGVYRDGKVELVEIPAGVRESRVMVTFLPAGRPLPTSPTLTPEERAELRGKLAAWDEDWNAPGMEAYDDL